MYYAYPIILSSIKLFDYSETDQTFFLDIVGSEVYESLEPNEFYDTKNIKLEDSQMFENLETLKNLDRSNDEEIDLSGEVYPEKQTEVIDGV